jgi:hypothetical protein
MLMRKFGLTGLTLLATACWANAAMPLFKRTTAPAVLPVPIEELASRQQEVRQVLQSSTLVARGPTETFTCRPDHYFYFLEHPDRAVQTWRRLGAKCVSITELGNGQFGWADDQGSEVTWETVHHDANMRIWYAHGKVRPAPLLPMVPVEVVLVLHHDAASATEGSTRITHHADLYLHTDSKTAALFARLMGTSSYRLAEQGLTQLQLFFSALSWYLDQHPDRAQALMRDMQKDPHSANLGQSTP